MAVCPIQITGQKFQDALMPQTVPKVLCLLMLCDSLIHCTTELTNKEIARVRFLQSKPENQWQRNRPSQSILLIK